MPPPVKTSRNPEFEGMTPKQIRDIQTFYDLVWKDRDRAAEIFYDKLFEIEPETRRLFKGDMVEQRRQLMAALGYIITNLQLPNVILPSIKKLAVSHAAYGVVPRHYASVGIAMNWTLQTMFRHRFTQDAQNAWAVAYGHISTIMIREAYPNR